MYNQKYKQMVIFRKVALKPPRRRGFVILEVTKENVKAVTEKVKKIYEGKQVNVFKPKTKSKVDNGDLMVIVRMNSDEEAQEWIRPENIRVALINGTRRTFTTRKLPHCVNCHSNNHVGADCPWNSVQRFNPAYGESKARQKTTSWEPQAEASSSNSKEVE